MLSAMIVDDEAATREALHSHLPWAELGVTVLASARNGLEALAAMQAHPADIILCDVRMPKMDGVALAAQLRQSWPECSIIFLSGYSDKEYLKTAIRVQAAAYLDKPLNIAEISATLRTVVAAIHQRQAERDAAQLALASQASLEPLRRRRLAEELAAAAAGGSAAAGGAGDLAGRPDPAMRVLPWLAKPVRAGLIAPVWPATLADTQRIAWESELISQAMSGEEELLAGLVGKGRVLVLGGQGMAESEDRCRELAAALDCWFRERTASKLAIGFSSPLADATGLPAGLDQAEQALSGLFYHPEQLCQFHRSRHSRPFSLENDLDSRLRACIATQNLADAQDLIQQAAEQARAAEDADTGGVRRRFAALLAPLAHLVPGWTSLEAVPAGMRLEQALERCPSLESVRETCADWLAGLFNKPGGGANQRRIERAQTYIRENAGDPDLTVARIASQLALSEAYLCTVFKEETGLTVKEAITRYRIQAAREMLAGGTQKLQVVALAAGFRDTNYFSTVFKRETGVTPGEFRQRNQK